MDYTPETLQHIQWYYNCWLKYYEWYMQCCNTIKDYYYVNERNRKRKAVALAAYLIDSEKKTYKRKKFWVAPIFQIRKERGFFNSIFPILHLEDLRFYNYHRMSAEQLEKLLNLVGPDIHKENVIREPIDTAQRLVLTLRFLASGDSVTSMSYQYLVGVTTAYNIIFEVCKSIWKNLSTIALPSNFSEEMWTKISNEFEERWNFPHCLGAIDGKHVVIQCPKNAGSTYFNYKGSHSVVLLAMCTGSYVFTCVDIGSYGRRSDGGIYKDSNFGKRFENDTMNVPQASPVSEDGPTLPYCIVGDEVFPLKSYLLRPYPGKNIDTQEKRVFNYRLSRARRTIENTFGIIASKWRIFRKPILLGAQNVTQVIQAVVWLHNMLRIQDLEDESLTVNYVTPEMVDREDENRFIPGTWRNSVHEGSAFRDISHIGSNMSTRLAVEVREKFCFYFNKEGSLEWQYDYL